MDVAPRRRRLVGGRPHAARVRFSDEEFELIQLAARGRGVSVSRFLADSATSSAERWVSVRQLSRVGVGQPSEGMTDTTGESVGQSALGLSATERRLWVMELMGIRRILAGLGTNMNQVAARLNATGEVAEALGATTLAVQRVVHRLSVHIDQLGGEIGPRRPISGREKGVE